MQGFILCFSEIVNDKIKNRICRVLREFPVKNFKNLSDFFMWKYPCRGWTAPSPRWWPGRRPCIGRPREPQRTSAPRPSLWSPGWIVDFYQRKFIKKSCKICQNLKNSSNFENFEKIFKIEKFIKNWEIR